MSMRYSLDERQSFYVSALLELGRRQHFAKQDDKAVIRSPDDAAELMRDMRFLDKEHFVCLFLNTKNQVISKETISIGSLNAAIVHPREVFRAAIRHEPPRLSLFTIIHPAILPHRLKTSSLHNGLYKLESLLGLICWIT